MAMIPQIRELWLKMDSEIRAEWPDDPKHWIGDDEIAFLESIKTVDDILNYVNDERGDIAALAYDCAIAMGLSRHDAALASGDE